MTRSARKIILTDSDEVTKSAYIKDSRIHRQNPCVWFLWCPLCPLNCICTHSESHNRLARNTTSHEVGPYSVSKLLKLELRLFHAQAKKLVKKLLMDTAPRDRILARRQRPTGTTFVVLSRSLSSNGVSL